LLEQSLRLFREFYDLDNAANSDFMSQLQDLQKMVLKPEKPDISGSLYELQRILSQRENAPPEPVATETMKPEPAVMETMEPEPAATETMEPEPAVTETMEPEPAVTETMEPEPATTETTEPGNG
jgi:uncharacterized protein HemX